MDKTLDELRIEFEQARQAMWDMENAIEAMRKTAGAALDAYRKKRDEKS